MGAVSKGKTISSVDADTTALAARVIANTVPNGTELEKAIYGIARHADVSKESVAESVYKKVDATHRHVFYDDDNSAAVHLTGMYDPHGVVVTA